jgi:hypothetical protein
MSKYLMAAASLAIFVGATGAQAATLSGYTKGLFTGTDGVNVDGGGQVAIWPESNCTGWGIWKSCTPQSELTFLDNSSSGASSSDSDFDFHYSNIGVGHYLIGGLVWYNGASNAKLTDDAFSLFATLTLNLSQPNLPSSAQALSFAVTNTQNPTGDIIGSSAMAAGGLTYNLNLPVALGDGLQLASFSLVKDGSANSTFDPATGVWTLKEGKTGKLYIKANVTEVPSPVPLPAAAWMLLAGVGGLVAAGRRRKAA